MKRKFIPLLIVFTLVLSLFTACGAGTGSSSPVTGTPDEESAAPVSPSPQAEDDNEDGEDVSAPAGIFSSFTATDIDGNEVDESIFSEYTLTLVNIWATFCPPCIDEMPDLAEIHAEYAELGVQVVGIVADTLNNNDLSVSESQVALAKEIIDLTGAEYLHLIPSYDLIMAKIGYVSAVPETIFIDSSGAQVGKSYVGSRTKDKWAEIIDGLLAEMEDQTS